MCYLMFLKHFVKDNTRPSVKKVSQLIDKRSHKQKKYISLMVVPSYSNGKTRSIRIPRVILHGVIMCMLVVTAIVSGLSLRANYFRDVAYGLDATLSETEAEFSEFRSTAEQVQYNLIDTASQIYSELNESEYRAQYALNEQARHHQTELEVILEQVEEIERMIREFDEDRQAVIAGLSSRADVIPPVAGLLSELEASEAELRKLSLLHAPFEEVEVVGVALLGGVGYVAVTHCTVQEHLQLLVSELEVQRKLMQNLEYYRELMYEYLYNFPTLWPIVGEISSGFGWRRNPTGVGSEHHRGVDIPARTGTQIRAAGGGVVVYAGWRNGYGYTVMINHGNGIVTLYAHNSRNLVTVGQHVARGDVIAHVGSTGRTTGSHLHYEVQINGEAVDPRPFMRELHS